MQLLVPSSTSVATPRFSSSTPSLLKPSPPLSRQPPTPQRRQGGAEIVVRIRLARFGCRNRPFYRVMAADSRSPRDGKHLEVLGYYNPLPGKDGGKRMGLKFDRVKYWLSVGAQPSDPVERLLFRTGILPPPPMLAMARKGGPRDRCPIDPMTGRPLDVEGLTIVDDTNTPGSEDEAPNEEAA